MTEIDDLEYDGLADDDTFEDEYESCCGEEICEDCGKPYLEDIPHPDGMCECKRCASPRCIRPLTGITLPKGHEYEDYCPICYGFSFIPGIDMSGDKPQQRLQEATNLWAEAHGLEPINDPADAATSEQGGTAPEATTTQEDTK